MFCKNRRHTFKSCKMVYFLGILVALMFLFGSSVYADWATTTVGVGTDPFAICLNPNTNKIYVANRNSNNVTVIDGATNSTTTVGAGTNPWAICVNPNTNKIYVANYNSNNVTVIDGATNATTTVTVGNQPYGICVNPNTNKIYVANYNSDNVTVIDGVINATTTVGVGTQPLGICVNPNTNKIYVTNKNSDNVTVIDGATNATITVTAGDYPYAICVNPNTNKIYVTNYDGDNVTVIDGVTNSTTTVAAGDGPYAICVNPNTNKIYVANWFSNNVTVLDGATNATTTVAAGTKPNAICVNPNTNKIYVSNNSSANVTVIDGATNSTTTVVVGITPCRICVNPNTNKIYVANWSSNNVTVIDGANFNTTTVGVGDQPWPICLNPNTNKIYVGNYLSANVTVIDGATNGTTTVGAGDGPRAICVNPVTNKIYVANYLSANVTVIDGVTNGTTTVGAGDGPFGICVNPNTNKIYVTNHFSDNVTVIDGVTHSTTTVVAGTQPDAICVNPNTNKIYVANRTSANVTVIDGSTNSTTTVVAGDTPTGICVNPNTNKIYVQNQNSNNVTVIDGADNSTTTVTAGTQPHGICVNPVTNKIYVANYLSDNVTVIDGVTNGTTTVGVGDGPAAICVNPNTNKIFVPISITANVTVIDGATNGTTAAGTVNGPTEICVNPNTNKIYVTNATSDNVTVLEEVKTYDSPLASSITPFPGNISTTSLPVFTGNSINSRSPTNCDIMKVLYKLNTTQEPWHEALITGGIGPNWVSWEAQATEPLTTGFHSLYVVALDMTSATINMTENFVGSIEPYYFFVASSYIDIVEYNLSDSYTPTDPWMVDGTVALSFTVRNVSEQVIENIGFSSSDLINGSYYIYGNEVTFSPSVISELQPGYVDTVTATVPVVIGQAAGTYTGTFCASPGRSSPDYVNVSLFVDTLWDIDVQDYGASLVANTMTLVGVENSVVLGKFNLDNPNTKDDNFDPYDGPGNIKIENIAYMPGSLFAYGNVDTIPKSNISMVASVTSLETGGAYQCILQVAIPAGKPTGRDFVGDFTVESGSINDEFRLKVIVVEPGGSVTSLYAFWGDAAYNGNHLYWTDFSMNEKGYNLYRSDASDTTFARLNSMAIAEIEYLDMYVRLGVTYQYKLGIKLGDNKELLIGPISLTAIGGPDLPSKFSLRGCYPNPFSETTMISFQCPVTGDKTEISLRIYDLSGRIVKTLVDEECRPGYYTAKWDGRDRTGKKVSSGIYFYRLNAGDFESVKKLILLR